MSRKIMKGKDIDRLDEVFRSKLYDFEAGTNPDDWEAIAKRLPAKPMIPFYRTLRYWVAAAVVSLLMVTGGFYLFEGETEQHPLAREVQMQTDALESRLKEEAAPLVVEAPMSTPATKTEERKILAHVPATPADKTAVQEVPVVSEATNDTTIYTEPVEAIKGVDEQADVELQPLRSVETRSSSVQTDDFTRKTKEKPVRKWRFGMGGGGLSMAADNVMPQYVTNSSGLRAENLQYLNKSTGDVRSALPKTNIEHKVPVSVGLTVSRSLNNRFALQTGLVYSYLLSEWETNGDPYHGKTKQGLHFIGIPLSVTYLIAEWNRFQFYGTGGGMAEMNVSGRLNTKLYDENEVVGKIKEDIRMKPLLWSLNARVGVSYPLLRFLSAYAEGGAGYYFDNGSDIETIRSEKPFNLNFQFGLRVGF